MKKTKLVTSLVLTTALVSSSMTAFAAGDSVDWDSSGSNHIQSGTEANGGAMGNGDVVATRRDKLFLVALPNSADRISFTVDASNKVYSPETVNFQNSEQKWNDKRITDVDDGTSTDFRSAASNWVMAYNAGSIPVDMTVSVNTQVLKDGETYVNPSQLKMWAEKSATNYSDTDLTTITQPTQAELDAHEYTIRINNPDPNVCWKTVQKGQDYWTDVALTDAELKATYDGDGSVRFDDKAFDPEQRDARFPYYTMGAFRIRGEASEPNWWTNDTVVRLSVKWSIRNPLDQNPWIESNWTIEDIQEGTKVPIFLGNGSSAATKITSVEWDWLDWTTGVGGKQELLGQYCKFVRKNTTETYLEFTQEGLSNLAADPRLLPANITVKFDNGRPVTFTLWIK